mgnify:CR=1 FL=1|tara:strand:- start:2564 stop:3844 length:1281 start_codon:yes stop_codon:yes gene_type:complete
MKIDIYNKNFIKNESFTNNLTTIIYSLIPVFLIIGTAVSEFAIILLTLRYLVEIFILKKIKLFKDNLIYFLLIIYFALLVNLIFSVNINNSILRNIFFIKYIIFIIGTIYFLSEKKDRLFLILKIWTLIIIIFSFDLYIQYFTHKNLIGLSSPIKYHRLSGFMGDELKAGSLLLSISFVTACFLITHTKLRNTSLLLLFIFLITIFITGDRSNFIKSIIITLFLLIMIDKKYLKKFLFLLILSFSIISFTISNNDVFKERYLKRIYYDLKISSYNISNFVKKNEYGKIYTSAYALFSEKKIFGLGNKNYRIICEENFQLKYDLKIKNVQKLRCNTHPHQIYFEILSEHGLFGLIIMLSLLLMFIYHNLYYVYKSKNILLSSMFISILITFIPLLPGGSFFTSFNATLFWVNFSFYYAYKNICNQIK